MHMRVDHAEPKTEIQTEQVKWVFEGPEAPSVMDTNIVVIKAIPGASNHHHCVLFRILS
jgi:hypothetical protein